MNDPEPPLVRLSPHAKTRFPACIGLTLLLTLLRNPHYTSHNCAYPLPAYGTRHKAAASGKLAR